MAQDPVVRQTPEPAGGHQARARPNADNSLARRVRAVRVVGVVHDQKRRRIVDTGGGSRAVALQPREALTYFHSVEPPGIDPVQQSS